VSPDDPLRVLIAGDSIMANLEPALTAALIGGGAGETKFLLSPVAPRAAPDDVSWDQQLTDLRPDLVIMLVGGWEIDEADGPPTDADGGAWAAGYTDVINRFTDQVSATGAHLLWVAMPLVDDAARTYAFDVINETVAAAAAARPDDLTAVDASAALLSPDGTYLEVGQDADGTPVRLRRLDGSHLCPAGVTRMAEPVLAQVTARWDVPLRADWATAEWTAPWQVHKGAECPDPSL
jgi:hypothetical protein